jgi:MoxR-like ATPase
MNATAAKSRPARSAANTSATRVATRDRLVEIMAQLDGAFVGRTDAIECIALAALTRENFLFIGEPGTAKTALVERFFQHVVPTRFFNILCGSFTTLDELCGPPDIKAFQAGKYARQTADMLPEADVAFLDEAMKCNDGAMNSLLKILNERTFENRAIPLRILGSATNWPEVRSRSANVEALYDRFVLRHVVEAPTGPDLVRVLKAVRGVARYQPNTTITLDELDGAAAEVDAVDVPDPILEKIGEIVEQLAGDGVVVSPRRAGKCLGILQARAWLSGRNRVELADMAALRFVLWTNEPDIAAVDARLATLDRAQLREALNLIDSLMARYRAVTNASRLERLEVCPVLIKDMKDAGGRLLAIEPLLTESSLAKVRAAKADLKAAFIDTRAMAKSDVVGQ